MCAQEGMLSREEMEQLEKKLKDLHKTLAGDLKTGTGELRHELSKNTEDDLSLREDMDVIEQEGSMAEDRIHLVEDAMQRMADGTYGRCLDCGCRIPVERLDIVPYAKDCVPCEEKREK